MNSFQQIRVCLLDFTRIPLVFFHFMAPLLRCVRVCVCLCASVFGYKNPILFTRWNAPWHCDSCVELVSYEQSLTWNAILETHTFSDSSKNLFADIPLCIERWRVNNSSSRHEEKLAVFSLWFTFYFDIKVTFSRLVRGNKTGCFTPKNDPTKCFCA